MTIESPKLQAMSVGGLIHTAFRLYCRHFWSWVAIVAAFLVPTGIIKIVLNAFGDLGSIIGLIELIVLNNLILGALTLDASNAYHDQTSLSFAEAYRVGWQRMSAMIGLNIHKSIRLTIPLMLINCSIVVLSGGGVVLALLIVPFLIWLIARWVVSVPVLIVENVSGATSLERSWQLTDQLNIRIIGFNLLLGFLTIVVAVIPTLITGFIFATLVDVDGTITSIIRTIIFQIATILVTPFSAVLVVLLYYDVRTRKEDYDLDLLAESVAPTEQPQSA